MTPPNMEHTQDDHRTGETMGIMTATVDRAMHFIDVRQKAFYLTEEIVGVQLAVLDKPMAIATQVLDYDIDWPDWVPKVRAGSKTLTCECVVLPPREFVRLAEEVAGRDRSS